MLTFNLYLCYDVRINIIKRRFCCICISVIQRDVKFRNSLLKDIKLFREKSLKDYASGVVGYKKGIPSKDLFDRVCRYGKGDFVRVTQLLGYQCDLSFILGDMDYYSVFASYREVLDVSGLGEVDTVSWGERGTWYFSNDLCMGRKDVGDLPIMGSDGSLYQRRIPYQYGRQFGSDYYVRLVG